MPISLTLLALCGLLLVGIAVVNPRTVFQYPVVVGFLIIGWVVPQAWAVERLDLLGNIDLSGVWLYILACVIFVVLGFWYGRRTSVAAERTGERSLYRFDQRKLAYGCLALIIFGAISYALMGREAVGQGSEWTGVVSMYALFSQGLLFGAALSWLIYLRTGNKRMLLLSAIAVAIFIPVVLFAVKRSAVFELAIIYFLGLFFVRHKAPSRTLIIVGAVLGTILIHQVGNLRHHIEGHGTSVVDAILEGAATQDFSVLEMERAPEIASAAVDIYYTGVVSHYRPFVSIWNRLIHQYVPAFIVGDRMKNSFKFQESIQDQYFESRGATRTGFSDSFRSFWVFGVFCFFAIAYGFGRLWAGAVAGDVRSQFFYIILLNDGLIAMTESVARFVATLPFLVLATWLPFYFARRKVQRVAAAGFESLVPVR